MVKKILLILLTVVLATACFSVSACKKEPSVPTYTITFDTNGGSTVKEQKVEENAKAIKPANPTKEGYEFDNWYFGNETTPFDFKNTSINQNMTLRAQWNIKQYSITFDTDGGNPATIDKVTQDYGTTVVAPENPTKKGYVFAGWFEDGKDTPYAFNKIEARDVSLKAKWTAKKYTITFDTDGGEPATIIPINQGYGTQVVAPANPTKEGYTFAGWYEISPALPFYMFNTMEDRDITLKASWVINQYSIDFNTNGGSPATINSITQDYGTAVAAPANPTRVGHTFIGWFEVGKTTPYIFNKIEARDVSLKANWSANKYSITFDSDGGTAVSKITQDYGTAVATPANPEKVGYNFLGWFEEGKTNAYVFRTIEARNVTLKAKWGEIKEYSITFDSDGGTPVATIIKRAGVSVSAPTNPTKTGYTFDGWYEDGKTSAYAFSTMEERNVLLVAKWKINQYSITFNSNGGSAVDKITQDFNTAVVEPTAPKRDGYVFLGWFETGKTTAYEFNTIEARDVTLTAKWGELRGVITLDKNMTGQNVIGFTQNKLIPYVGQEMILPELECWGYKFLGWKNLKTNQMLTKTGDEYKITHAGNDVTYQAQWEKTSTDSDIV